MDNRARSAEKSRNCFVFLFFPSFFSSFLKIDTPPPPPPPRWLGIEKGVTPGAHPLVPDGFQ